ncbi:hypothetical protein FNV43_RR10364 [Rhamnella rubrinervis]|uniref:Disease resistance protein Roq1-like winged-helix domain-containing protein n=1 Tax=Rhamnella rubrinervis TaxID=2594499 RepID=A0A8K0ML27_9ROSA|nr:hypothetical protein FNV43_RR10364 [Rhamnella rubrinervis]
MRLAVCVDRGGFMFPPLSDSSDSPSFITEMSDLLRTVAETLSFHNLPSWRMKISSEPYDMKVFADVISWSSFGFYTYNPILLHSFKTHFELNINIALSIPYKPLSDRDQLKIKEVMGSIYNIRLIWVFNWLKLHCHVNPMRSSSSGCWISNLRIWWQCFPLILQPILKLLSISNYKSKDKSLWNAALCRLRKVPEKQIVKTLKISFDDHDETDKDIFLDIACFFNRYDKDETIEILDSCGFDSKYGISNHIDKSLLSIHENENEGSKIWMHDLLEVMGKDILREESGNNLGNGSSQSNFREQRALSSMKKLRLFKIDGLKFLGLDDCDGAKFSKLISCVLYYSIDMPLHHLKVIDLTPSIHYTKFEHFTVVPNLEKLILKGCWKLSEIHPSIKHLKKLILLDLSFTSLEKLPEAINSLASLETLNLGGHYKLKKCPDNLEQLKSLRNINISESGIRHLPSSFFLIKNLESVRCDEKMIESAIRENIISFRTTGKCFFPNWFCALFTSLTRLDLSDCNLTRPEAFPEYFGILGSLEYLDLSKNPFSVLPLGINGLSSLRCLRLEHCKSLRCLEAELLPSSLQVVYVDYCTSLGSFLDPLKPCHLRCSSVSCLDCTELVKRQDGKMTALASLSRFLEEYPSEMGNQYFDIVVPQSDNELPSWFINQSSTALVGMKLDSIWRSELMRFAMVFCLRANPFVQEKFSCVIRVRCGEYWDELFSMELGLVKIRMSDHLFLLYGPPQFPLERISQLELQSYETLECSFYR